MSAPQPPSDPSQSQGDEARDGALPDKARHAAGRPSWKPVVIGVVAVVIAAAVAGVLLLNHEDEQPKERAATAAPLRGLACPYLQQASDAFDSGDHAAFESAIAQATDVAEGTLQTSGQAFGKPERIALELGLSENTDRNHIASLLELALQDCLNLGAT
jgi:hypothetical protein